jgi:hypothetical protein
MNTETWRQDCFIESERTAWWTDDAKEDARRSAKYRVVLAKENTALCVAGSPEQAIWIAERLNLAERLENEHS